MASRKKIDKKNQVTSLATQARNRGIVRIVGGKFKRTPLQVDDKDGLRPTPERVRETVFDWLTHLTGGFDGLSVCDMFSGSGAMGIESASRGAAHVTCIEFNRRTAQTIGALVTKLKAGDQIQVVSADAFAYMEKTDECFDLIFIDPPFAHHRQMRAAVVALSRLGENGIIYIEDEAEIAEVTLNEAGLKSIRRAKAGAVHYLLASRNC